MNSPTHIVMITTRLHGLKDCKNFMEKGQDKTRNLQIRRQYMHKYSGAGGACLVCWSWRQLLAILESRMLDQIDLWCNLTERFFRNKYSNTNKNKFCGFQPRRLGYIAMALIPDSLESSSMCSEVSSLKLIEIILIFIFFF